MILLYVNNASSDYKPSDLSILNIKAHKMRMDMRGELTFKLDIA